jgi:nitroreductase
MNRREFLTGAGVFSVVVVGGAAWYASQEGAFSQNRGPAYQPWQDWNEPKTGMLAMVRAAILAASPHNTQPWLFRVENHAIDVFADTARNTGGLDPHLRELHIGIGCALENIAVAAPTAGYAVDIVPLDSELRPNPTNAETTHVATVQCTPATLPAHPLYSALPQRHTNRKPYSTRALPEAFVHDLNSIPASLTTGDTRMFLFTAEPDRKRVIDLVGQSDATVYADKRVGEGTVPWERVFHWRDVEEKRDGITLADYGVPQPVASAMYCLPDSVEKTIMARTAKGAYAGLLAASALFGVIAVKDRYSRSQCLQAGRVWQRAHLFATANGIAARPINEAVELVDIENAEGRPRVTEAKLAALTGTNAWQPTFMFRMGYASETAPASPRRSLSQVMLQS